jgi:hypothetical protein
MRILIYIFVLCFISVNILQITSAFDLLNMFRRAVGITNQSEKYQEQYQKQLLIKSIPRKHYYTKDFDYSHERHLRSLDDNSCRCCS